MVQNPTSMFHTVHSPNFPQAHNKTDQRPKAHQTADRVVENQYNSQLQGLEELCKLSGEDDHEEVEGYDGSTPAGKEGVEDIVVNSY